MQYKPMFRVGGQVVFGLIVITLGVLLTLDNMGVLEAREILRYWPVLLIVWGITKLTTSEGGGRFFGIMLTLGGSLLLLDKLYVIDFGWREFWPLLLIAIGGTMLWNSLTRRAHTVSPVSSSTETDSVVNHFALMGGIARVNNSQDFRGGELSAIMGGIELDLRQANIQSGEAVLNIFAFWGGIELKVPEDWTVIVQATPIMGGVEDTTHRPKGETKKKLIIKGTAIMGGAEIKN